MFIITWSLEFDFKSNNILDTSSQNILGGYVPMFIDEQINI